MKRLRILALMILVAAGFTGCQTEPVDPAVLDNNPIDVPGDASFTVQISGEAFEADITQAVIEGGLITIAGVQGDGETVGFVLAGNQEGVYNAANLEEGGLLFSYSATADAEYTFNNFNDEGNLNGIVEITEIDEVNHTISGTFSFTGYYGNPDVNFPSIPFTNGQFTDIPYETDVINPGGDEYFNAVIDGNEWEFDIFGATALGEEYLSISANDFATQTMFTITVEEDILPGTYPFSSSPDITQGPTAMLGLNQEEIYTPVSGTLTIISNDGDYIKGTFSYTGINMDDQTIPISGEFNVEVF